MNALEVTQRSFDAWNRHDADAILALYAEGGTYIAPRAGSAPLTGQAIANYAKKVFTAYPDVSLEIISSGDTGGGLVASQWVLHGTHTGILAGRQQLTGEQALALRDFLDEHYPLRQKKEPSEGSAG
jgi:uncharacterized protein (TIGR02246 family)